MLQTVVLNNEQWKQAPSGGKTHEYFVFDGVYFQSFHLSQLLRII